MSGDPFHDSKYSVSQAKRHLAEFERQIVAFFKTDPYRPVDEIDPKTQKHIHKVKLVKPMPVDLPGIAVDIVNHLRASLDKTVSTIAALANVKSTYFPFAETESDFDNTVKGRCKELPEGITTLLRSFKPHKGGNDLLWALNKLANTNKHSPIIAAIATASAGVMIDSAFVTGNIEFVGGRWDRAKNEMIVYRADRGSNVKAKFQVSAFIAICDVEIVDGQPAEGVFRELIRIVESIVLALEAESKRIGLIP
jgi:hypothetical protein